VKGNRQPLRPLHMDMLQLNLNSCNEVASTSQSRARHIKLQYVVAGVWISLKEDKIDLS